MELRVFEPWDVDVCPGYVCTAPAVVEASKAYGWAEKGQLALLYPAGVPQLVIEAVETLTQALNLHQSERLASGDH